MLKKAGIIVAASVAGMLALSPLAFASESHDDGKDRGHGDKIEFCQANDGAQVNDQRPPGAPALAGILVPIGVNVNAFNNDCSPGAENGILNHLRLLP